MLTQQDIRRYTSEAERETLDRKLECHAFHADSAANAEFAKDLCAMANNGNRRSVLLIGVSDDGSTLKSVKNSNLTDDNLQDFARHSIYPVPRLKLERHIVRARGKGPIALIAIVVGPNKRTAYRISRDFAGPRGGLIHRRNEVWVRRRGTSELAAPEQIAKLVAGEDLLSPVVEKTVYGRLSASDRRDAFVTDLATSTHEMRFDFPQQIVRVEVGANTFVLRLIYFESPPSWLPDISGCDRIWGFEHGIMIVTPNTLSKGFFAPKGWDKPPIIAQSREAWGDYSLLHIPRSGIAPQDGGYSRRFREKSLRNGPVLNLPVFALHGAKDSIALSKQVRGMISFLGETAASLIEHREALNSALRDVVRRRAALLNPPSFEPFRPFRDAKRFGEESVHRVAAREYVQAAKFTLYLSANRMHADLPPYRIIGEKIVLPDT